MVQAGQENRERAVAPDWSHKSQHLVVENAQAAAVAAARPDRSNRNAASTAQSNFVPCLASAPIRRPQSISTIMSRCRSTSIAPHNRPPITGGGAPIDPPWIVAVAKFFQRFELRADAAVPAELELIEQPQLVGRVFRQCLLRACAFRINLHGLGLAKVALRFKQSHWAANRSQTGPNS